MAFKPVSTNVDFPAQEREILDFWKRTDAFNQLRRLRASSNKRFSFLDGPITANNPMGVHHAWGRTYKDLWQRYYAMKGHNERWQNGFDCQGLWIEVNVERDLGFKNKHDIEEYGIAPFVILCKQRVLNYAAVQTEQSIRLGYWVNWDDPDQLRMLAKKLGENAQEVITYRGPDGEFTGTVEQVVGHLGMPDIGGSYFTFSDENNYQIWRFLKKCHTNGWIYKGHDVMPWCHRCGTGISQHEIVTEGYMEQTDPGLTVRFPLQGHWGDGETRESLLVWTTTPWTLTSNVAAAVGPELDYVKVKQTTPFGVEEYLYLSKGTLHMLKGSYEVVAELKGREMSDWRYYGPFDDLPIVQEQGVPDAHRVIVWDEVGEAEGTGIVHIAPGCGQEDFALGKQYNLPVLAPLSEDGLYVDGFGWLTDMHVTEVTKPIVDELKRKGRFYRLEDYTHRYPQCWRCQTPLVFRLVDEWFIAMDGMRELLMEVTSEMSWIPEFGKDRELDWLRNMHDWMISKKRYWGLALPIWECAECGHFEIVGSLDELKERAVEGWQVFEGHTPHRPYIDAVKIKCSNCGATVERIKDVGNPWLDAGIVSISTMGYSYNYEEWQKWFPADFITESFPGQFRNWFYSLLTMAAVLTEQPVSKTVLGFGTLFGEDGRAMHKSWGNSVEFNEGADRIGADVMRWMFVNHKYEADILFGYRRADETRRRFFLPLWNVYSFFVTYANLDGWAPAALTASGSDADGRRKTVVYVEDEPEMIDLVHLIVNRDEFALVGAIGGHMGIETIRRTRPDIVLLDLMMPDMDGWEVYQQMRSDPALRHIPVIVITAKAQSIDRILGVHVAKVNRYLTKPFNPEELLIAMRESTRATHMLQLLDRWILARLQEVIDEVTIGLNAYDAPRAGRALEDFVEDLSNWYVRRSRRRFWKSESDADKQAAYATLYQVLTTLARLLAPLLPFISEAMYQNLERSNGAASDAPASVHHCDWPLVDETLLNRALLGDMAIARQVVALGHATRAASSLKVRQPLAKAIVVVSDMQRTSVEHMRDIIADELNVKVVELAENEADLVTYKLLPDNKKLGPKFGAKFPQVRRALDEANAAQVVAQVRAGEMVRLSLGDDSFELAPDEILIRPQPRAGLEVASEAGVVVALDTALTPELVREGLARDVVRRVQELRKQAGFDISDHIVTSVRAEGELQAAVEAWSDYIKSETLSDELRLGDPQEGAVTNTDSLDGVPCVIGVSRV